MSRNWKKSDPYEVLRQAAEQLKGSEKEQEGKREKKEVKEIKTKKKSGSEKRQQTKIIGFRALPEEVAQVEEAAQKAGVSKSEYVRQKILGGSKIRAARRPTVEAATLGKLLAELGKIGSNLNQIAHRANMGQGINSAELNAALTELRAIGRAIIEATGRTVKE